MLNLSAVDANKDIATKEYADTKALKTEAIKNITRSGTTFTATRCDNTTFTFTQQDNNSVTGVKGNAESSYRTGNVNLTAANVGAIAKNAECLTTNPFRTPTFDGIYISKIDNGLYAADKRWTVTYTGTSVSGNVANLFDGNYESRLQITKSTTGVVLVNFANTTYFPGYPYGYILVSFYYNEQPESVSGRVYCNYSSQGVGWKTISFTRVSDSTTTACVYRSEHQGYYNISQMEITVVAGSSSVAGVNQIEIHLDRPHPSYTPFVSKYAAETLYYNLTAPKFIGALQGNADTATNASKVNNLTVQTAVPANAVFTDTVTRVKGNSESTYRTGDVNLTAANIGAAASSHAHGNITSGGDITAAAPTVASGDCLVINDDSASKITNGPAFGTSTTTYLRNDGTWATPAGGGTTVDVPTGTVSMFAGSTAPTGYLLCQGQAVSRTTYSSLFSVIGTTYGTGDGSTTFNLPNLQGKFALGKSSSYALGSTGGASTVTLTTNQIPAHTHGNKSLTGWAKMWGNTGFIGRGGSSDWGGIVKPGDYWYGNAPAEDTSGWQSSSLEIDASHEHDSVGGGQSHDNMPPYQTVNYIIKT